MSGLPLARHSPPTACKRVVSGTISLPSQGFFSPFPHGTGSLSVTREYLGLASGLARFTRDFTGPVLLGNTPGSRVNVTYGAVTRYGGTFQNLPLPTRFVTPCRDGSPGQAVPLPPIRNDCRL